MGKSIRKITNTVKKAVTAPIKDTKAIIKNPVKGVVGAVKGLIDIAKDSSVGILQAAGQDIKGAIKPSAPAQVAVPDSTVGATQVATPDKESGDADDSSDSASTKKKAQSTGKKSLTVARTSGGGINV